MGFIKYNNLGKYGDVSAVWDKHPEGGREGDYVTIGTTTYYWDKYTKNWIASGAPGGGTAQGMAVEGDLNVGGDLSVGGDAAIEGTLTVGDIRIAGNNERFRGQSAFRIQVFTRADEKPGTPEGGQYSDPMPNGVVWSEGVPPGNKPIWMSSRTYTSDGESPQDDWSDPLMLIDSDDFDVEFSPNALDNKPVDPSPSNLGTVWFDPVRHPWAAWQNMNWVAMRNKTVNRLGQVVWGAWTIMPTRGARGADGDSYENVFYRTGKKVTPIPSITNNSETFQTPDYCPGVSNKTQCDGDGNSFTDNPRGVSERYPYEWMMQRRKRNGLWQAFSIPPVLFATYSKEHTIAIDDATGCWIIDGELTHKQAVGKGVAVKGSVEFYSTESTGWTSGASTLEDITEPELGDSYVVEDDGHLYLCVATSGTLGEMWHDLGEFKGAQGADGHSQYLYLAWANEVHFAGNPQVFDYQDGYTTDPAEGQNYPWMGILVSDTEILDISDDSHASEFKWNYLPGRDGTDYEHVYIRTKTNIPPTIDPQETGAQGYQSPEYKPNVYNKDKYIYVEGGEDNTIESYQFTDDPNGISEEWPYEWQSRREKIGGVWQAFQSPAILHRNWAEKGEKGDDGAGQAYVRVDMDQVVIDCTDAGVPKTAAQIEINAYLYWGDEACTLETVQSVIAVQCTGFGGNINNCASQTSIDTTKGYIKLIIKTRNPIASGTITFSLAGEDSDGGTHTATKVVPIIANTQGAKGAKGDTGAVLRFKGEFDPNDTTAAHVWNENYRDCVKHGNGYYMVGTYGTTLGYQDVPGVSNAWVYMGASVKFFATELLLAENAAIEMMSTNKIIFKDAGGDKTAGINEDQHGSYVIYYPSGRKRYVMHYTGWNIYYNDDEENTEAWRIGNSGEIIKASGPYWSSKLLCSLGSTEPSDNSFTGDATYQLQAYPQYFNPNSADNEKIFVLGTVPSGNTTGKTPINGYFTDMAQPEMEQSSVSSDTWMLTVYHIVNGEIVDTLIKTTNRATQG